jgi:hypothetical protein
MREDAREGVADAQVAVARNVSAGAGEADVGQRIAVGRR